MTEGARHKGTRSLGVLVGVGGAVARTACRRLHEEPADGAHAAPMSRPPSRSPSQVGPVVKRPASRPKNRPTRRPCRRRPARPARSSGGLGCARPGAGRSRLCRRSRPGTRCRTGGPQPAAPGNRWCSWQRIDRRAPGNRGSWPSGFMLEGWGWSDERGGSASARASAATGTPRGARWRTARALSVIPRGSNGLRGLDWRQA